MYEGGIREPMIIRWPGVTRPGSTCDAPVISTDFYPTLLEMAGLPLRPQQHLDGCSLVPLLSKRATLEREALFWHYPHYGNQGGAPGGAVRAGDWKLIEWYEDGKLELYNLKQDLSEQHDLADQHPERVRQLHAELEAWRKAVGARMPAANPRYDPAVTGRPFGPAGPQASEEVISLLVGKTDKQAGTSPPQFRHVFLRFSGGWPCRNCADLFRPTRRPPGSRKSSELETALARP